MEDEKRLRVTMATVYDLQNWKLRQALKGKGK